MCTTTPKHHVRSNADTIRNDTRYGYTRAFIYHLSIQIFLSHYSIYLSIGGLKGYYKGSYTADLRAPAPDRCGRNSQSCGVRPGAYGPAKADDVGLDLSVGASVGVKVLGFRVLGFGV